MGRRGQQIEYFSSNARLRNLPIYINSQRADLYLFFSPNCLYMSIFTLMVGSSNLCTHVRDSPFCRNEQGVRYCHKANSVIRTYSRLNIFEINTRLLALIQLGQGNRDCFSVAAAGAGRTVTLL